MIEKNNPFSLKKDETIILSSVLKNKKVLNKMFIIPESRGICLMIENICKIIENGHIILETKEEDFNSTVSRSTIEKLFIKDILMPFNHFAIKFKGKEIDSCIFIWNKENEVIFSKSSSHGVLSCSLRKDECIIKDTLDEYSKSSGSIILDALSVIMYFTAFERDKNRVAIRKVENKNRDSKKIAKTMSIISLNSAIYSNLSYYEAKSISDKSWIVKGHWRNQHYSKEDTHKLKWIDCYWKGQSKEIMQKIYKIN